MTERRAPWLAYLEAVEAGEEEADAEREQALADAFRAAEEAVTFRPSDSGFDVVSEPLEAKIAGNHRALYEAEVALKQFASGRLEDLVAERAAAAAKPRDRMVEAWATMREAEAEWYSEWRWWRELAVLADMDLEDEAPEHPLRGLEADVEGRISQLPMPRSLQPESGR